MAISKLRLVLIVLVAILLTAVASAFWWRNQTQPRARFQNVFTEIAQAEPRDQAPLILEALDAREADTEEELIPEELISLYGSAFQLIRRIDPENWPADPVLLEIAERVAILPERFPEYPEAHYLAGRLQSLREENPISAIRSFRTCLDLEPGDPQCLAAYNHEVLEFTKPRCEGRDIPGRLEFYLASMRDKVIQLENTPRLSNVDIDQITSASADQQSPGVAIRFNESGRHRLADLTKANQGLNIAVVFDGQVLAAPKIERELAEEETVVTSKEGTPLFVTICPEARTPELPQDLRL